MLTSWAFYGVVSAFLMALIMLLQERLKVEGYALAVWCKVACVIVTLPFIIIHGLPSAWQFYACIAAQAVLFAISDVIMFRALPEIGAGVMSRLLPSTVIVVFFLWFAVDPSLVAAYMSKPVISALICLVLCGATFFAARLKRCEVSMRAFRILWFVLFANCVGPLMAMSLTKYASPEQGTFARTFVEAGMMITLWLGYLFAAKPIQPKSLLAPDVWRPGLMIGAVMAVMVTCVMAGLYRVDNPAYMSAMQLSYAVIVMGAHRWMGRKDDSDVMAGIGIVACAVVLVILKAEV